jgi:succinate dehydrogenase/fumarate reductase flavoprotein subunit
MKATNTPMNTPINTHLAQFQDNDSVDVLVLGSGAAGFSAALNAAVDGAKVLLVERTAHVGGTTAWSAATTWVPGTQRGLSVNPEDTLAKAAHFLDLAVGERSNKAMRQVFLDNGAAAIGQLEAKTELQFQVRMLHPDYMSELPDSVLRGRAIEPQPFDGKRLGANMGLVRPPIPEFTVLGGMMVDRDDIFHLLRVTDTFKSFSYCVRILTRHFLDKLRWPRSTRWVMGNAMIGRMLLSYIERQGHLVTHTEATELLHNGQGVYAVRLRQNLPDGSVVQRTIQVKGGVVLATGGFNRSAQTRAQLLPGADAQWSPAAPGHTGTAQALALQLGAQLGQGALSNAFWAPVSIRQRADGTTASFPHFVMDRGKPGMLTVDQSGKRYVNESTSYHLFGIAMQAHHAHTPSVPSWLVCDAAALQRYGIGMIRPGGKGLAPYLADGYLKQGRSLADLAAQLNVPADNLQATVARFNQLADAGEDTDFQRGTTEYQRANGDATWLGPNPCLGALRQGPFYAIALYPGDIGAATGLVCDTDARVLNASGQAIGGLYACGNDMHSIMGGTYPAPGITIGPGVVFGYIAARHAVARTKA